jgi:hypothetical protein
LACWQPRQAFAQAVTSVERPFHTYLEEMRRRVARLPGWAAPWRCSNTCRRRSLGTSRRKILVDESPMSDDAQSRAGAESLYMWAEDLAESHVLEVVGDGCADPFDPGGGGEIAVFYT